ncbi:Na+/H+ antiporter NhaA [Gordonia sp. LUNF6]|uniref:Na+/H+ antiporter NhaA n=1 Tax=unclassified Gordonia (in: high G+C Gram-positive bacteria) TaxID=2657482 RepID=UPI000784149D|nr:Na+/H+ antiporter NhaA [Gordonia sp. QH-12]KXT56476.1 pH-dependent sodium/proton antiporter [Gordonia sp. QH-12]
MSDHEVYGPSTTDSGTDQGSSRRQAWKGWISGDIQGGAVLLVAALLGFALANSPWREGYHSMLETVVGPASLHLDLSLAEWAADGLLAIFFFVVGLELKHEFVAGSLRDPRRAGVPVAAAVGGMVVPALIYVAIVATNDPEALRGWATPTATDIAFALAVFAIFGAGLPSALRVFLMTLAVVDDLLGIIVIATVYTETIDFVMLAIGLVCVVAFGFAVRLRRTHWWILAPLGLAAWGFVHASGVHSTVAGVLLGFAVPAALVFDERHPRTESFAETVAPISAGIALPLFAFASAGVTVIGVGHIVQPVSIGVFCGLVVGKVLGVVVTTFLVTRLTPLRLAEGISVRSLVPVGLLTGIGFTVALLIAELSFSDATGLPADHQPAAKVGILLGSLVAAVLGGALLRWDVRHARVNGEAAVELDD